MVEKQIDCINVGLPWESLHDVYLIQWARSFSTAFPHILKNEEAH
jgi:hypothetical protein